MKIRPEYLLAAQVGRISDTPYEHGGCIPLSFVYVEALAEVGIPARLVNCAFKAKAFGDARTGESVPGKEVEGRDPFLGHCIVYLPTKKLLVDVTLGSQHSDVLRLAMPEPKPVYIDFDQRKYDKASAPLDRGEIVYHPIDFSKKDWKKHLFEWEELSVIGRQYAAAFRR